MLERIGNCRIVDEVASGGMAVVYRAIQDDLNRTVAIKALKSSISQDEQLVTRFEREAQSLAELQHENIIHIYDFYRERGALFIVMEYVSGIDLYDLLERCGRLPFDVAAIIALQVARALDYVHYRNVIHRDIKPANIMISRAGGVKLMDFGIARDSNYEKDLTESGTGIGTPSYMSPEQILGDRLDARSDLFSLGIVLYQMLTGRKPFVEDEQRSVMHKIREEPHEKARKLNPELPRELERIVDKCLQKSPKDRWRSGQALVMALERFLSKHVEMNYHARLVLFLKNQDIITQLEADEYVNPAMGAELAAQPNLQVRRQVRRTLLVQSAILAVVGLMVGLIHLAPVGAAVPPKIVKVEPESGFVRFVVNPWGEIVIDGESKGFTPMARPILLPAGEHELTVKNDFFEPYPERITVVAGPEKEAGLVRVDLEKQSTPLLRVKAGDDDAEDDTDDAPEEEQE
jgi:serine/threonine-protein kinase